MRCRDLFLNSNFGFTLGCHLECFEIVGASLGKYENFGYLQMSSTTEFSYYNPFLIYDFSTAAFNLEGEKMQRGEEPTM